jgi:hypothetical protein
LVLVSLIREIITIDNGLVSSGNSTSTPLGIGGIFQGAFEDTLNYNTITVGIFTDQASASDGLVIEWSANGVDVIQDDAFSIAANTGKVYTFSPANRYIRIVYTNGGVSQTSFNIQSILKKGGFKPSSHRVKDSVVGDDDAELQKAVITGENPSGIFKNVKVNNEDALSITSFLFEVARGNIPGIKMYSIPGRKDGLSSALLDDLTQIPGTIVVPEPGGIQLQISSSSAADTSAGTGIQTLDVHYLDPNGDEQEETVTMNGTTPVNTVATDIDFIQWIHAKTVGTGGVSAGNISVEDTGGAVIYEYIEAGGNQSLSAKYKVPNNKTGYVVGWQASGITKKIDLRLRATVERFDRSIIPGVFLFQDILVLNDATSGWIPFLVPLKMPSGAVIKLSGISSAAGGDGAGQFDIMIVDD